ncbi:MAG: ABC transporter permease [Verrucomicrobiota bacterium]
MLEHKDHIGFQTLFSRECHRFLRLYNQTLIPPLITAVLYILIFGYSLGSRISSIENVSYMHFLIPGLVMMSVISASYANTSSSLYIARFQGHIQELLVSSLSTFEIVAALILGGVVRGICAGSLVGLAAILLTGITISNPLLTALFMVFVAFIFSCAGFLSAMWAQDFDRLSLFQTYILSPMIYLGGVFFSVSMLPGFWQTVARANPMLYFVNGLRYGFLGISDVNVTGSAIAVVIVAIVVFSICYRLFSTGYNIKT